MTSEAFIRAMPKVELHVHLEGSIQPATLLQLAQRNSIILPVQTVEAVQEWFTFTDFGHFIEIYFTICDCLRTPEDFELVAREFLIGQAAQNIRYTEVIYTPFTHRAHVPFLDQLAAINRARAWAEVELGVRMNLVMDVSRDVQPVEHSLEVADWAVQAAGQGVIGFGLGGPEVGYPPELFAEAFARARSAGLASLPHAGETVGPESIWGALRALGADRLEHGVRCLEDPALVDYLRKRQIPLDVCPTSNICLGVFPTLAEHPLPRLLAAGLHVTIGSDDPPMFNTTLTEEYLRIAAAFGFGVETIEKLVFNGVQASRLPAEEKVEIEGQFRGDFERLRQELGL